MSEDRKPKSRGNGQGSVYRRKGQTTWTCSAVVGWKYPEDPSKPRYPVKRTKGGFKTKKEAAAYLPQLYLKGTAKKRLTLQQTWNAWKSIYESRVVASTMDCYKYAYKHFAPLHGTYMDLISSDDLQLCMDACKAGKRTHENMRCIAGLLWGYACDQNIVDRDVTKNLFIGHGTSVQRDPVTIDEVKAIRNSIGIHRYSEYVYCLCLLGFRPGEFLELKKDMLHCAVIPVSDDQNEQTVFYFVNGKKTEAGKNRIVVVPELILDIVLSRLYVPGTDYVFPQYHFNRKKEPELVEFKLMNHQYFNREVFKPLMISLGFSGKKSPYCSRHTYADLLKEASGSDKDKAQLIGHSNYLFTQTHYQSSELQDLKAIVDSFKDI